MQTENNLNSPELTPESSLKKVTEASGQEQSNTGKLTPGAEQSELKTEPPVFKLHCSFEGMYFIKANSPAEAKAKLLELQFKGNVKDDHITFLETIPHEQYKDFKVEIID